MTPDYKNIEKYPYLFFQDDYFEYLNVKIGRKMTKLAIFHPFWRLDSKYPDFEQLLASFDGLSV